MCFKVIGNINDQSCRETSLIKSRYFPKPIALLFCRKSTFFGKEILYQIVPEKCFEINFIVFQSDLEHL